MKIKDRIELISGALGTSSRQPSVLLTARVGNDRLRCTVAQLSETNSPHPNLLVSYSDRPTVKSRFINFQNKTELTR